MSTTDHTPTAAEVARATAWFRDNPFLIHEVKAGETDILSSHNAATLVRAALAAAPAGPDDAHTETVTEYRVLALHIASGDVIPLTDDGEPRAKAMDRAKACRDAGFLRVRVESRTVTTSRRESEWKAADQ